MKSSDYIGIKNIWSISYPIILGGIAQTLINITDSAFLGRISEEALGASAIGGLFYVTIMMLGMGFSIGGQIVIARLDGEKKYDSIGSYFRHGQLFLFLLSIVSFLLMKLSGPALLTALVQDREVLRNSLDYIEYRSYGYFFAYMLFGTRSFFSGIGKTAMIFYTTLVMALANVILNYMLVYGNWGMPRMESAGAALASSLSEMIAYITGLGFLLFRSDKKKYGLFRTGKLSGNVLRELFSLSAPVMLQFFFSLMSWFIFFMIVERMGSRPLAISNLIRNTYMILMIPLMGFSSATNTLVSNLFGRNEKILIMPLLKNIMILSGGITLLMALLGILFREPLLGIFTTDQGLIEATIPSLFVITGSLMMYSVVAVLLSAVSGSGNTRLSLFIELITIAFYLFATWVTAVALKQSIEIVWAVEYVYFLFLGGLSLYFLQRVLREEKNLPTFDK